LIALNKRYNLPSEI